MKRIASLGVMIILLLTALSVALAQGQFNLMQSSVSNGSCSSGGVYSVRDTIGESSVGVSSGGVYQVRDGLALNNCVKSAGGQKVYLPVVQR